MKSTKAVAEQIAELEGFDVEFVARDGSDISSRRVEDYPYSRAARGSFNVAKWKNDRFAANYPDFDVIVYNGDGKEVHGRTLLDNLRATYGDVEYDEAVEEAGDDEEAQPSSRHRAPAQAAGQTDIESWLWEAANILRGPVDPANLRDFVFRIPQFGRA